MTLCLIHSRMCLVTMHVCSRLHSVESLPAELRDFFNLLVVFDYDTLIPSRALETIWDKDDIDTDSYLTGRLL